MSVYITTNKDINTNALLVNSSSLLTDKDILIIISLDIEHSPVNMKKLQQEAEKNSFSLRQVCLTENEFSDMKVSLQEKCALCIQQISDKYLNRNGERKLIFVGFTIVPVVLSLFNYLRQRNITVESRMEGFLSTNDTVYTEYKGIETYFNNKRPTDTYEFPNTETTKNKKKNNSKKNNKKNKKNQSTTLEISSDDEGIANVSIYKPSAIVIAENEDDEEVADIEFDLSSEEAIDEQPLKEGKNPESRENDGPIDTEKNTTDVDVSVEESTEKKDNKTSENDSEYRTEEKQNTSSNQPYKQIDVNSNEIAAANEQDHTKGKEAKEEKIESPEIDNPTGTLQLPGPVENPPAKNTDKKSEFPDKKDNNSNKKDSSKNKNGKHIVKNTLNNVAQKAGKLFGLGTPASASKSQKNVDKDNIRYENSHGQSIIQQKLSRQKLQDQILKEETQEEQKAEKISDEKINRLKKYDKLVREQKSYFQKQLGLKQLTDRDFFVLVNAIQYADSMESFKSNIALQIPLADLSHITAEKYAEYSARAEKIAVETNKCYEDI